MNRRSSISAILGSRKRDQESPVMAPPSMSLNPYTGPWTESQASHLMRRTMFGPNQAQIKECFEKGLNETLEIMFDNCVPTPPPVIYTLPQVPPNGGSVLPVFVDPYVSYGETWINEPVIFSTGDVFFDNDIRNVRKTSVEVWPFVNIMKPALNIMPKLWLFWHNHFVVSDLFYPLSYYEYSKTLEDYAKGNFRDLTKAITIDIGMLNYLNGNSNSKEAPNENYARELLELFTVGKGDIAGPGDYTTFTEQDVQSMARVLTGWEYDFYDGDSRVRPAFNPAKHDSGDKELSPRFNSAIISDEGENEYKTLIDVIFEEDTVAIFLAKKFYRYFVNYEITDQIELDIIEPLAQIIRDDDYGVERALKVLLSSEHFFGEGVVGCMVKNPCDFIFSASRGLNFFLKNVPAPDYFQALIFRVLHGELDMGLFFHPNVAGWKAYYQEPQYYRYWINTYLLPKRNQISASFIGGGMIPYLGGESPIPQLIDVIGFTSNIDNAEDPNAMIYGIANNMFANPISEAQKDFLKEIILSGLPDFEWTVEYTEFLSDPTDPAKREAINNKLVALFKAMTEMPEFQLM